MNNIYIKLKEICDKKIEKYPQYKNKYNKEIILIKRYFDNNVNILEELSKNRDKISTRYVIPFLLGFTKEVTDEIFEYKLIREGSSGGIDIDMDFSAEGKEKINEYLKEKYGDDKVISVGTFSKLGNASAAKDLLRIHEIDFQMSNQFTKLLKKEITWEENIENIKKNNSKMYQFYLENKDILDLVPQFTGKTRQTGKHAGGVVITKEPFNDIIPTIRVGGAKGEVVTAFEESSTNQSLDEIGIIKYDILAIKILDILKNSVNLIKEELFLIEEDGVRKIVPESYLKKNL